MRIEATAEEDFAAALEPCSPPVATVSVVGPLTLRVEFEDGVEGEVVFSPEHLIGVFEPLKDAGFFREARVKNGAVTWPGELDLRPTQCTTRSV